ncbi:MAG: hypothetical protein FWD71_15240 [Oscillospiraceae bacterium]|nr:hypothetical protein [Oscillospiraceae bacterium]
MNNINTTPKVLVTIIDRGDTKRLEELLNEKHAHFRYMFDGMGTANSEILKAFGLSGTEKTVCLCLETSIRARSVMTSVVERLSLTKPGNGISFILQVSGISASISQVFERIKNMRSQYDCYNKNERHEDIMQNMQKNRQETEISGISGRTENPEDDRYELVVSVVNQGFSEILMESAKAAGARGGTIIHARRMGVDEDVKFFGISVQAEKELVAIVILRSRKKELMQAITKACGIHTGAHGIVLSLPIESCAGLGMHDFDGKFHEI